MTKYSLLTAVLIALTSLIASGQTCDDFNRPNSTTVTGWTEQVGDWSINNNTLQSPASSVWNYITYDGFTPADGCLSGRFTYSGAPSVQFMGLLARYANENSNIMVKLQDNGSVGYWNSYFFYCDNVNTVYANTGLNFGTDANVQVEFVGTNITLRIDPDRNGTWDYTYTATLSNTNAGMCGAASYAQCNLDDWCYATSCCTTAPDPAGTIAGSSIVCVGQNGVGYSVPVINNATSYVWTYSGNGATINGSGNSITINFSAAATSGNLTVYGYNSCGNGTVSAAFNITVDPCTGTEDISALSNIQIFPNPGSGNFMIHMDAEENTNCIIKVLDVTGRQIYESEKPVTAGRNQLELDLAKQDAGVYYLNFMMNGSRTAKMLMIAK